MRTPLTSFARDISTLQQNFPPSSYLTFAIHQIKRLELIMNTFRDPCESIDCNEGVCEIDPTDDTRYVCTCAPGYRGSHCNEIDPSKIKCIKNGLLRIT